MQWGGTMRRLLFTAALAALFLLGGPMMASAADGQDLPPLTEDRVIRFLAAAEDLQDTLGSDLEMADITTAMEARDILAGHGFDGDSWSVTAQQVMRGYSANALTDAERAEMLDGMEDVRAELAQSGLPPEQQAAVLAQMEAQMQYLDADPSERAATAPHIREIERVFDLEP